MSSAFAAHVHAAQRERDNYKQRTVDARQELEPHLPITLGQKILSMKKQHYTFDFAQQLFLPCQSRQVGPLYFKVPYRVQLFGVCNEGLPLQINYLIGKHDSIGENGSKTHGPNTVISCLHHYFEEHGIGERVSFLHADNCAGQNKNRTFMAYLSWRTVVGLHDRIEMSFMIAGHTRCTVDGCFGMVKRKYRRSDCNTIQQLADIISSSAHGNKAQLTRNIRGEQQVTWYAWDAYFMEHFKPLKGISKLLHFVFDKDQPGVVQVRESVDSSFNTVELLKSKKEVLAATTLPPALVPPGLSDDRAKYLYDQIRDHVRDPYKDVLCPKPANA